MLPDARSRSLAALISAVGRSIPSCVRPIVEMLLLPFSFLAALPAFTFAQCPDYSDYSKTAHAPFSSGRYNLSYMRPDPACRTFNSSIVEGSTSNISSQINDPDLKRLFENTYPNTLDTAIRWKGYASGSDEELTFVITGGLILTTELL